jgi:hypothetical protein
MDIYIVVGVYAGVVNSVHAYTDKSKAEKRLAKVKKDLDIVEGAEEESPNAAELTCVGLDMD